MFNTRQNKGRATPRRFNTQPLDSWDNGMKHKQEQEDWYLDISDGLQEYLESSEELEYTPPWIDEDLLDYSLHGVKTIKNW